MSRDHFWRSISRETNVEVSALSPPSSVNVKMCIIFSGVRDYIHVVDLARGHVSAVKKLDAQCGFKVGWAARRFQRVLLCRWK